MKREAHTFTNTHHGHAVKRIRHSLGIKQEVLGNMIRVTQAPVSNYEQERE